MSVQTVVRSFEGGDIGTYFFTGIRRRPRNGEGFTPQIRSLKIEFDRIRFGPVAEDVLVIPVLYVRIGSDGAFPSPGSEGGLNAL